MATWASVRVDMAVELLMVGGVKAARLASDMSANCSPVNALCCAAERLPIWVTLRPLTCAGVKEATSKACSCVAFKALSCVMLMAASPSAVSAPNCPAVILPTLSEGTAVGLKAVMAAALSWAVWVDDILASCVAVSPAAWALVSAANCALLKLATAVPKAVTCAAVMLPVAKACTCEEVRLADAAAKAVPDKLATWAAVKLPNWGALSAAIWLPLRAASCVLVSACNWVEVSACIWAVVMVATWAAVSVVITVVLLTDGAGKAARASLLSKASCVVFMPETLSAVKACACVRVSAAMLVKAFNCAVLKLAI